MNNSDYIALGSAVISCCALFGTIWQAWLSHRHNRLSVKPFLVWHIARRNVSQDSSAITFSIKNLGLGPAIVKERYFTKNEERFKPPGLATDEVQDFTSHVYGKNLVYILRQYGLPGKEAAIASGQEIIVADIEYPGLNFQDLRMAIEKAGNVGFHVIYESIYGERFEMHQI
jgi:hypothetical protein